MRGGLHGYKWRKLLPAQVDAIRLAYRGGASLRALASAYDCSYRTLYRAVHRIETETTLTLRVGDYEAPFAYGEEGPIQLGPWVSAVSNHGLSGKITDTGVSGNHDSATMRTARIQVLTPPVSAPFVSPGVRR